MKITRKDIIKVRELESWGWHDQDWHDQVEALGIKYDAVCFADITTKSRTYADVARAAESFIAATSDQS
jgi:hypothetical protein